MSPERLGRKVDWVTKRLMIERYMAKHDLPLALAEASPCWISRTTT